MIEISNLSKHFFIGEKRIDVLRELSLSIKKDKITVILGRSGCGKTTLLRLIAGLESVSLGEIKFKEQAKIGFVFQEARLMPFLNVYENIVFALKKQEIEAAKIDSLISMIGLSDFKFAAVSQLSGGMRQRVGIARAYCNNPDILLLDEPFGHLDAQTRYMMEEELQRIWQKEKRTVVFVTNNIEEAVYLADRIILLTNCPSKIKKEYKIDLPFPRNYVDPKFLELRKEITENMDKSF